MSDELTRLFKVFEMVPLPSAGLQPDEEDIFCSNCGARNPQGATQCLGCGRSLR